MTKTKRVITGFWKNEEDREVNCRGVCYSTFVLLYNDNTYENINVYIGKYYKCIIHVYVDELMCRNLYGSLYAHTSTISYRDALISNAYSIRGMSPGEAKRYIKDKMSEWRNLCKKIGKEGISGHITTSLK